MKKLFLLSAIVLFYGIASAQSTALQKVVDSSCKCLTDAKNKIKTGDDFDRIGQGCIMKAAAPYLEDIAKEEGIPIEDLDSAGGEKLGQKIGLKLATSCPVFLELYSQFSSDDNSDATIKGSVKGTIINVETADRVILTIKDDAGKLTKVTWLAYFEGADAYKANPLTLKGKKAEIGWTQIELYSVKQRDFIVVKEVTSLNAK